MDYAGEETKGTAPEMVEVVAVETPVEKVDRSRVAPVTDQKEGSVTEAEEKKEGRRSRKSGRGERGEMDGMDGWAKKGEVRDEGFLGGAKLYAAVQGFRGPFGRRVRGGKGEKRGAWLDGWIRTVLPLPSRTLKKKRKT
jgi:hypothetical protein